MDNSTHNLYILFFSFFTGYLPFFTYKNLYSITKDIFKGISAVNLMQINRPVVLYLHFNKNIDK